MLVNKEKIIAAIKNVLTGVPPSQAHWRALSERNLLKNSSAPNSLHKGSNVLKSNSETAEKSQISSDDPPLNPEIEDREKGSKDDVPILMPFGDLTVSEGKVVSWHYAIGDLVKAGDTIAEVETDKAVLEIDSPETGTLIRIDIKVGEVVQMGARIGGLKK
jgi:biotin carboxyl carrier protein